MRLGKFFFKCLIEFSMKPPGLFGSSFGRAKPWGGYGFTVHSSYGAIPTIRSKLDKLWWFEQFLGLVPVHLNHHLTLYSCLQDSLTSHLVSARSAVRSPFISLAISLSFWLIFSKKYIVSLIFFFYFLSIYNLIGFCL